MPANRTTETRYACTCGAEWTRLSGSQVNRCPNGCDPRVFAQVYTCRVGAHEWRRAPKRGPVPKVCPEHGGGHESGSQKIEVRCSVCPAIVERTVYNARTRRVICGDPVCRSIVTHGYRFPLKADFEKATRVPQPPAQVSHECAYCGRVFQGTILARYCRPSCRYAAKATRQEARGATPIFRNRSYWSQALPSWRSAGVPLTCVYCEAPGEHADHVVPRSKGGSHDPHNLVPACASCNTDRSNLDVHEWIALTFDNPTVIVRRLTSVLALLAH